jgi:N-acetylglucosamine repressor
VLNPQLIALAGELMQAQDFVLPRIRGAVELGALRQLVGSVEIRPSTFGNDAPLIGAGTMALDTLFKSFD